MRLICTLHDQDKATALSSYMNQKGIQNQLEIITNTDWGSPEYGLATFQIWSIEEDQLDEALKISREFLQNPEDPKFYVEIPDVDIPEFAEENKITKVETQEPKTRENIGIVTMYLLIICTMLLLAGTMTSPSWTTIPKGIPYTPVISAPINKVLMFDYPKAYEIVDKIIKDFGLPALQNPETLPKEGQVLLNEFNHTPYWQGIYSQLVEHVKNPKAAWDFSTPMFEKEKQGEIWRLFTPALLHSDFFHLLFNMIWLVVLGRQMEQRLGKGRYILFILVAAVLSNLAQYFMSGSNFLGFSGVLCAMLTFIWFRQRRAAWEGYSLEKGTMAFITFFILFMFSLQVFSFLLESFSATSMPLGVANTAHLVGGAVGYVFSRMQFFAWR